MAYLILPPVNQARGACHDHPEINDECVEQYIQSTGTLGIQRYAVRSEVSPMLKIQSHEVVAALIAVGFATHSGMAEVIRPDSSLIIVQPGESFSIRYLLAESQTPLFGYSLDLNVSTDSRSVGSVSINADASSFFDQRNLFTAGGLSRDPLTSLILSDGFGGVFVSSNASTWSSVTAETGVNDALAELVFEVSADAFGDFTFALGGGSVLSDRFGNSVGFSSESLTVRIVPAPGPTLALLLGVAVARSRRRRN
jgi:hypothetical protein